MERKFFQKPSIYVGEVHLHVTKLATSLAFYEKIFGFQVLSQTARKAVLSADGSKPLLILEQPENALPKEEGTTGLYHFAILLPTRADLSSFLKHVIHHGIRLGASDHYVSEALYFSDPDGNGIEVYRDRPSEEWGWSNGKVAMATDPLDGEGLLAESNHEWNGLPKETVIGHIHLHVSNLATTKDFYVNGLGFSIVAEYPGALFASTGKYHHHLGLNIWNGAGAEAPAKNSAGLHFYTLVFPDEETREKATDRLKNMGTNVVKEKDAYVTEDPSGNGIRLMIG